MAYFNDFALQCLEIMSDPQLLLLGVLSCITLFRREISCNHCYSEEEESGTEIKSASDRAGTEEDMSWLDEAEELLDRAGIYCPDVVVDMPTALFPLVDMFLGFFRRVPLPTKHLPAKGMPREISFRSSPSSTSNKFAHLLSLDAQLHILGFLAAKDLVTLANVDKSFYTLTASDPFTSRGLWRAIFQRDIGWVVQDCFELGLSAKDRCRCEPEPCYSRDFYFLFLNSYVNFLLAGRATPNSTWLSIRGCLYDMTPFLEQHPGSPETVLVHAGREATTSFGAIRHSTGARRVAQSLCMVVYENGRLLPTSDALAEISTKYQTPKPVDSPSILMKSTDEPFRPAGLESARRRMLTEEKAAFSEAQSKFATNSIVQEVHVYYNPFDKEWGAWYIKPDLSCKFETLSRTTSFQG